MKTKNCPFCDKEISDEAIICKFCHRLLIDENGNDILPESIEAANAEQTEVPAEQPQQTEEDDKTIVYSKDELKKAMESVSESEDEQEEEPYEEEEEPEDPVDFERPDFRGNGYTYNEDYAQMFANAENDDDEEIYPEEQNDEYDPKRTFIITAIITLGILIVVIAAVCVGYKLFGFGDDDKDKTSSQPTYSALVTASSQAEETTSSFEDIFIPQVTDDTVSEAPEETSDSTLSDPVVLDSVADPNASSMTDSSMSSTDPSTDSTASAADSTASTDSTADSSADSAAADPNGPGFAPAGSYYSWDEANTIINNYFTANGMDGSYSYQYGTDGVEMVYGYTDENGNTTNYRVDLQTGAVSAI